MGCDNEAVSNTHYNAPQDKWKNIKFYKFPTDKPYYIHKVLKMEQVANLVADDEPNFQWNLFEEEKNDLNISSRMKQILLSGSMSVANSW